MTTDADITHHPCRC